MINDYFEEGHDLKRDGKKRVTFKKKKKGF